MYSVLKRAMGMNAAICFFPTLIYFYMYYNIRYLFGLFRNDITFPAFWHMF